MLTRAAIVVACSQDGVPSRTKRYAVIGCKLKQNANEGCNSCASLAGLVLCFVACFILLVIAPLRTDLYKDSVSPSRPLKFMRAAVSADIADIRNRIGEIAAVARLRRPDETTFLVFIRYI